MEQRIIELLKTILSIEELEEYLAICRWYATPLNIALRNSILSGSITNVD